MEKTNELEIIEYGFLGAILGNPKNMDQMINVTKEWFSSANRGLIFDSMLGLYRDGKPVDPINVKSKIMSSNFPYKQYSFNEVDVILNIADINPANFESYQAHLEEKFLQREVSLSLNNSIDKVKRAELGTVKGTIDEIESELFTIAQRSESLNTTFSLGDIGVNYMKKLKDIKDNGMPPFIADTGLRDIDRCLGGFEAGDLIYLAARPSMGKTALALQFARNNIKKDRAVGIISLEMASEGIFLRQLSSVSKINGLRIRSGQVTQPEFDFLAKTWKEINKQPLFINDQTPLNEINLRGIARRMVGNHDIKLLIIDYLQLLDCSLRKENRQQEISSISKALKALAKELKIPVLALSQLSRAVESRTVPRPVMSDLRDSGTLEQDADIILFIYRPEYYGIETFADGSPSTGQAEIIVGKARNADTGSAKTIFQKDVGRFENLAKEELIEGVYDE